MEHRRLTLVRGEQSSPVTFRGDPVPLPGRMLALTDTDTGALAVSWSLALITELAALGLRPAVMFLAFARLPTLEPAQASRFSACCERVECRGLEPNETAALALREELTASAGSWLLVGEPALVAFEARWRLLLRGENPVQAWSPALRAVRPRLALELTTPRVGVATQLARLLATTLAP